ncbi:MAG: DUF308 domain-containing protein [Clostridia bacterium]|nr:DUF308 domain-containing protein [Clostridia bacterium]
MAKSKSKSKVKLDLSLNNLLTCFVYAVIGILLVVLKGGSLGILMSVIGGLLIILGVLDAVKGKDLVKGVVEIVIGIAIIVGGWIFASIVLLIFGILLIVKGVIELLEVYKKGFMAALPAIVTIVIGVLLVIAKWALMDVICIIAGVIFIINAVLTLFGKKLKKK